MAATTLPSVRALLDALVDYAGLFPPAQLSVSEALHEYAAARGSDRAWMLGRFVAPASRLAEVADCAEGPLQVCAIVDASPEPREWFDEVARSLATIEGIQRSHPAVAVEVLEVRLPRLERMRDSYDAAVGQFAAMRAEAGFGSCEAYLELPFDGRWRAELPTALRAMRRSKLFAKIRCGGALATDFPSPQDVAAFLTAAREEGVAFKATAGLHHPIRHYDKATGFMMHGFLNLLCATAAAADVTDEILERMLADEIASDFSFGEHAMGWREVSLPVETLVTARRSGLRAYGSCSFREPVADLENMGVL